jgi:hypothetical protein
MATSFALAYQFAGSLGNAETRVAAPERLLAARAFPALDDDADVELNRGNEYHLARTCDTIALCGVARLDQPMPRVEACPN